MCVHSCPYVHASWYVKKCIGWACKVWFGIECTQTNVTD